jgi:hypothetical protein
VSFMLPPRLNAARALASSPVHDLVLDEIEREV